MNVKEMARLGGLARAKSLSKKQRAEIASLGGLALAAKNKNKNGNGKPNSKKERK
jgi:hypothetical protein